MSHEFLEEQNYKVTELVELCILKIICSVGAKCVRATYSDLGERVGVLNEYVSTM